MTDSKKLVHNLLIELVESESIGSLSVDQILSSFINDRALNVPTETPLARIDPRNDEPIVFNPSRAVRPHDYRLPGEDPSQREKTCPICQGNTTGILDWTELSEGYTFINKNLYPVLYMAEHDFQSGVNSGEVPDGFPARGLHFVQWTSTYHDRDWNNMPLDDCLTVMTRLSVLEKTLLKVGTELSTKVRNGSLEQKNQWFVSIIKNVGSAVGGSLEHGHQQIVLGNLVPKRIRDNQSFQEKQGQVFSDFLLSQNPVELLIHDYGSAALLVPIFMHRPFDMMLVLKDSQKAYLHQLNGNELEAVSSGWRDAARVFQQIMPLLNREIAYNIITHNGPGAGLYFEFLPYTQEKGGLEHLGISVSQADPFQAAEQIRSLLDQSD